MSLKRVLPSTSSRTIERRPPVGEHLAAERDGAEPSVVGHARHGRADRPAWVVPNLYQPGPDPGLGRRGRPAYVRPMSTTIDPTTVTTCWLERPRRRPELAARTPPATTRTAPSSTRACGCLREAGLLALAVPTELGGGGATIRQMAAVQRELAHHCGSTALATSMHQHVTCFTAWRYRRGLPGAEATLRRVADEGIVLVSTGGADFTHPRGEAIKVDGGYRGLGPQGVRQPVARRHRHVDDVPLRRPRRRAAACSTWRCPSREGVTVLDNWDTLGHAGHRQQRRRASRTCSCPTSGCSPTVRTA